jgi:hypothetical protein
MRAYLISLAAGLALCLAPSLASAQYFSYGGWTTPTPYFVPRPFSHTTTFTSPYGYRSAYTTGVYPTPYGSNTFWYQRSQIRPLYTGPYHSIYVDPFTMSYRYGTGFRNTPRYDWRFYR